MEQTNKKIMRITAADGSVEEVEVLLAFEFNDTKKEYVIYTKNETDENGNVTIYAASVHQNGDQTELGNIETDEEWSRIKDVLRELSKEQ
ncbi:MAG: DUF1292 domain-containing protein [Bacilli bacterium]